MAYWRKGKNSLNIFSFREMRLNMLHKTQQKNKKPIISLVVKTGLRLFLFVWSLTILLPAVWLLYSSFKNNQEFYESPWRLPSKLRFENFASAWVNSNISSYFLNSLLFSYRQHRIF
jgi:ABC-type glycerol-3-phosphate transport system permease component